MQKKELKQENLEEVSGGVELKERGVKFGEVTGYQLDPEEEYKKDHCPECGGYVSHVTHKCIDCGWSEL